MTVLIDQSTQVTTLSLTILWFSQEVIYQAYGRSQDPQLGKNICHFQYLHNNTK